MALTVRWTKEAEAGFDSIIEYLTIHFTDREIQRFIRDVNHFISLLQANPHILQKTEHYQNIYRGPINKYTILTYQLKLESNEIILLSIQSSRQKPDKLS